MTQGPLLLALSPWGYCVTASCSSRVCDVRPPRRATRDQDGDALCPRQPAASRPRRRHTPLIPRAAALAIPAAAAAATGPPALAWAPATADGYNYGTLTAGHTAATTFTLTNTGGTATSALKITLTGAGAFTKTADTCTGTSLGPRKTCTVTLTYTAQIERNRREYRT